MKVPVIDLRATGQNIKNLRVAAGISVRDLQEILGFTNPQAICKWQNGDSLPSMNRSIHPARAGKMGENQLVNKTINPVVL